MTQEPGADGRGEAVPRGGDATGDGPEDDLPEQDAAETERVRALLRAAAVREPMPAHVVARIDAALEQARQERPAVASLDERRRARARRWPRLLAAAAAVLVIGGTGVAVSQGGLPLGGGGLAPGAAGGAAESGAAESGVAAGPGEEVAALAAPPLVAARVGASGTAYTAEEAAAQVGRLLAAGDQAAEDQAAEDQAAGSGPVEEQAPRRRMLEGTGPRDAVEDTDALACAQALGARTEAAAAVDVATWEGQPAVVVVVPVADGGTGHDVVVVAQGCSPGDQALARFTVPG